MFCSFGGCEKDMHVGTVGLQLGGRRANGESVESVESEECEEREDGSNGP